MPMRTTHMQLPKNLTYNLWTSVRYWTYRSVSYLTGKLPVRFTYWIGNLAGDFVYLTWKEHSANAVSNMRRVLGENADWRVVKEVARDSFRNYAKTLVDFLRYPHLDLNDIQKALAKQSGWENLDKALAKGNG